MKILTCVIVGGGYAGIHTVKSIQKAIGKEKGNVSLRLILIDKNPYHSRKVLLFKAATSNENVTIPFTKLLPTDVDFIEATVTQIKSHEQKIRYKDRHANEYLLGYDILILATGSIICRPKSTQGGIALSDVNAARKMQTIWRSNLKNATKVTDISKRRQLMTIAIAGAGLSGIETSSELVYFVRKTADSLGLNPDDVSIYLINAHARLFPNGPDRVSLKIEQSLIKNGATIIHEKYVLQEKDGKLFLSDGETINVGLCIWTLGLLPNPVLQRFDLPLTTDGYVIVDESYRVQGIKSLYSIGDSANVIDTTNGMIDGNTCKEAIAQADRLGKIVVADMKKQPSPSHKRLTDFFCFSLGPEQGLVWMYMWKFNIVLTGRLGWWIRKRTWDLASMLK